MNPPFNDAGDRRTPDGLKAEAHAMAGDQDEILSAGLDHVLTKPLKKPLLLDMITRYRPDGTCPIEAPLEEAG